MQIVFEIEKWTSSSGNPAITFKCSHCKCWFFTGSLNGFFYQSNIPKDNLEQAHQVFVDSINNHAVKELFPNPKTGHKLINYHVCTCNPKVTDIEHLRGVKRAKAIKERALEILREV